MLAFRLSLFSYYDIVKLAQRLGKSFKMLMAGVLYVFYFLIAFLPCNRGFS